MKTLLLYLAGAIAILILFGFVMGYITYTRQDHRATITVDTEKLEKAKAKTREATAGIAEEVGDAVEAGGRKLEDAGDDLHREASREQRDGDNRSP